MTTQAILGEKLQVLETKPEWYCVRQWDGYEGWINQVFVENVPEKWEPDYRISASETWVYSRPDASDETVRQATCGVTLPGKELNDQWAQVTLPDMTEGFCPRSINSVLPGDFRVRILQTAERFLGVSYFWGGKTPRGFDCSGFVQTVFWLNGIHLKRDSYQQAEEGQRLSSREEHLPGDLLFFAEKDRISHVGIAYNEHEFIHCSGFVRKNSLQPETPLYRKHLDEIYVQSNRILN